VTHPLPAHVGRYRIERFIGQGGMGRLYVAHDPVLGREVAIKLVRSEIEDADVRERFLREARAASALKHGNVVTVFDAGEHEGHPFIAMEYVSGETLADLIDRREPRSLERKLQLAEQLCHGLASAHREGLVHRDIKPSNLMVDTEGTLKILDFGIARVAESRLTSTGVAIGTVNYMSPEQAAGGVVDHRSDIFSVGSVVYELLTFRLAFPGSIQDGVLYQIVHGTATPLRQVSAALPDPVVRVVERAMAAQPNDRYQDLDAMADDLAVFREQSDIAGIEPAPFGDELDTETMMNAVRRDIEPTPTAAAEHNESSRRRWLWLSGVSTLLLFVSVGLGPRLWNSARDTPSNQTTPSLAVVPPTESRSRLPDPVADDSIDTGLLAAPIGADEPTPFASRGREPPAPSGVETEVAAPPRQNSPPGGTADTTRANTRLDELRGRALDAFIEGNVATALRAASSVLQLAPGDTDAVWVLRRLATDARGTAEQARLSVAENQMSSSLFRRGDTTRRQAIAWLDEGLTEPGVRGLWDAADLFREAAREPLATSSSDTLNRSAGGPQPALTAPPTLIETPAPPEIDRQGSDRTAIAKTLDRYQTAFDTLDGDALRRVYPTVPRETLDALPGYEAYTVVLQPDAPDLDGDRATVQSELSLTMRTRTGLTADASGLAVFRLERQGPDDWQILSIDMSQVR